MTSNLNTIQLDKLGNQEDKMEEQVTPIQCIAQDEEVKQILLFSESDEENEELIENERHHLCDSILCIEIICYCACGLILLFIYLVT